MAFTSFSVGISGWALTCRGADSPNRTDPSKTTSMRLVFFMVTSNCRDFSQSEGNCQQALVNEVIGKLGATLLGYDLQVVGHNQMFGDPVNPGISGTTALKDLKTKVEEDGFGIIQNCLDESTVQQLCGEFDDAQYPQRNLLSIPSIRRLAIAR